MKKNRLYKYGNMKKPTHLRKILLKNKLWFSSPKDINDPLEFRPYFKIEKSKNDLQNAREFISDLLKDEEPSYVEIAINNTEVVYDSLAEHSNNILSEVGVCCFSYLNDNLLMWAHYSDGHCGYCIEFSTLNNGIFKDYSFGNSLDVQYQKKYPLINLSDIQDKNYDTIVPLLFRSKSKDWEYEKECRFLRNTPGSESFLPESLTGLILGCKMCEQDKKKIKEWISQRKTPLTLKQAVIDKKEYKLNFETIKI
ncbi:DUF2971 domain-containing protein [Gemmatimonadota bacterium]